MRAGSPRRCVCRNGPGWREIRACGGRLVGLTPETAEYRELLGYVIEQLEGAGVGVIHVMDGLVFGFHGLGKPMTLGEVRAKFSGVLIGNVGCTREKAEAAIVSGDADMIAFGRPYITNPDLVERFRNGWPLAPEADMATWCTPLESGHIDWPAYSDHVQTAD